MGQKSCPREEWEWDVGCGVVEVTADSGSSNSSSRTWVSPRVPSCMLFSACAGCVRGLCRACAERVLDVGWPDVGAGIAWRVQGEGEGVCRALSRTY